MIVAVGGQHPQQRRRLRRRVTRHCAHHVTLGAEALKTVAAAATTCSHGQHHRDGVTRHNLLLGDGVAHGQVVQGACPRVTVLHTARGWSAPAAALDSMPSLLLLGHRGAHDIHEKHAKSYLHIMFTSSRTAPLDLMLWGRSEFLKKAGRGGGVHLLIGRVHRERLQGAGGLAADVDVGIQQQRNKHLRITSRAQRAAQAGVTP